MPKLCTRCNTHYEERDNYCVRCGKALITETPFSVSDSLGCLYAMLWAIFFLFIGATLLLAAWKFIQWAWS
jgi:uncharacterized paraquat-inducible protein A